MKVNDNHIIDAIIKDHADAAARSAVETQVKELLQDHMLFLSRPEFETWGRYLTIKQAMTYAGYSSRNGLKDFLKRFKIPIIKNGVKDQKVDRFEIDNVLTRKSITDLLKG